MRRVRSLIMLGMVTAAAACATSGAAGATGQSSGEVATIDSLSASRTAVVHVENNNAADVRVFTELGGQENYIGRVARHSAGNFLLDPKLVPAQSLGMVLRAVGSDDATGELGPFNVARGQRIDVVAAPALGNTSASIHQSMP